MHLSAKEARELMPRDYLSSDQLFMKIKSVAESGLYYLHSDLTLGQVSELQALGYRVEKGAYDRVYTIKWDK